MIIELLEYVCAALEEQNIAYMLSGSLAMNTYTTPRMTRDIDIVVNLKQEEVNLFLTIFKDNYYFNKESIITEVEKKGMFNVIDHISGYKIYFVIKKDTVFRDTEFERRKHMNIYHFKAWIVSPEDLIISKYIWTQIHISNKQLEDIKNLLTMENIDRQYIIDWCKTLRLSTFNLI
jgi:hypothetical protein